MFVNTGGESAEQAQLPRFSTRNVPICGRFGAKPDQVWAILRTLAKRAGERLVLPNRPRHDYSRDTPRSIAKVKALSGRMP